MFIPVLAMNKGHHYTRRLILRPTSAACPGIDICTKKWPPPPAFHNFAVIHGVKAKVDWVHGTLEFVCEFYSQHSLKVAFFFL